MTVYTSLQIRCRNNSKNDIFRQGKFTRTSPHQEEEELGESAKMLGHELQEEKSVFADKKTTWKIKT